MPAGDTDEVGLERTADGVLHVAWTRPAGGLGDTVLHSAISADAKSVSGPDPILTAANNGIELQRRPRSVRRAAASGSCSPASSRKRRSTR